MVARCAFCGSTSPLADLDWLIRLPTCLDCRTGPSLAQPAADGLPRPASGRVWRALVAGTSQAWWC